MLDLIAQFLAECRREKPQKVAVYLENEAPKMLSMKRGKQFQWLEKQLTGLPGWKRLEGYDSEGMLICSQNWDDDEEALVIKDEHAQVMGLMIKYGGMLLDHYQEMQKDLLEGYRQLAEISLGRAVALEKVYGDVLELARKSSMKLDGGPKGDMTDQLMGMLMEKALPKILDTQLAGVQSTDVSELMVQVAQMKAAAAAQAAAALPPAAPTGPAKTPGANTPPKGK